jgi:hypothetical protein
MASYFGRFNEIYFHREDGLITAVSDRARRTGPVRFQERLFTPDGKLHRPELTMESQSLDNAMRMGIVGGGIASPKKVVRAGREYEVIGHSESVMSLPVGRSLYYDTIVSNEEKTTVLLTVQVPRGHCYEISCSPQTVFAEFLQLTDGLRVQVFCSGELTRNGGSISVKAADADAEVGFLFESTGLPIPVSSTIVVSTPGYERQAVLACAACGPDFVPCFLVPHPALWAETFQSTPGAKRAIVLGPDDPRTLRSAEGIFLSEVSGDFPRLLDTNRAGQRQRTLVAQDAGRPGRWSPRTMRVSMARRFTSR